MGRKRIIFILLIAASASLAARENSTTLYKRGALLAKSGKINESIKVFRRVVALSPWYCLGHYGLGKAYLFSKGYNSDAMRHLKRATELDRTHAPSHFYLGFAYLLGGKKIKAIHSFQRAYNTDDSLVEALYNIGSIYDMMNDTLKAQLYFREYKAASKKGEDDIF